MGKGLLGPNGRSGGKFEGGFGEHCDGNGGIGGSMSGVGEGKDGSMGGMGGGSLSRRSMVSNDGRGEDVEPKTNIPLQEIIIFDPDDQPMWENAKIVVPTPNSAIVQPNVDENFVINSTHLKMILENKFDGIQRADLHDHIHEFLAICDMFKYVETQSEAVKLLIFPFSLYDEAKTWFNELNEESITSWEQLRRAFINRFFPPSLFNRLLLEIRNFSQNIYKSLTDAWLRLKSMLRKGHRHDHHQKPVSFTDESGSNNDSSRFMEKLKAMDSQIISLNEELQDIRNKYNELREGNASKNDDTPMCERHEANYIQSEELNNDVRNNLEDFKRRIRSMRTVHWKLYDSDDRKTTGVLPNKKSKAVNQEPQTKIDLEKSMTKFLDDQRSYVSIPSLRMCTYGLCRLFWNIGIGIKLYEWAGNLVALELVLDHHLLDRSEDVEPKQIILDPDDQPMWESAKTVAPTPNSAIVQIDVDENFVINSTHMKMICENKFDGYLWADPYDQIREFLAMCDMFKYGETQSEAVKLMIFPYSLSDKAKT
ncbi:reverse transcriptase domain-containing protein [Tanacetum coccineum]